MTPPLLRYALLAGVAYFCCMAVAHFFGIKAPLLFVYYDTPFYAYQDKIIAFAVVAYIGLFHAASRHISVVPTALVVMGITVLGLAAVNMSDALASVMGPDHSLTPYWVQTGLISGYFAVLVGLYLQTRKAI
ncbi:hypothetical protein V5T82_01060 [Magnetovibrio sp. PR-2]|uniref:hypothetical protein n=1 Tax=Magnetovibrio sp. PR-2 TaxID=3120356 RepID=UPI002FCDF8FF